MTLNELQDGQSGIITKIKGRGAFRRRITEMGFVKGKEITVIKNAPLKDPVEYQILNYKISLRRSEARQIEIISDNETSLLSNQLSYNGTQETELLQKAAGEKSKIIEIALVGNPNSGKTTLFNFASGAKEHVGNYSGVTVDSKLAYFKYKGYTFNITDLPGTYSLSAYSPEELFIRQHIINNQPDVVVNIVDASNLERNLFLTTEIIDMDVSSVIALNMFDELEKASDTLEYDYLGKMIGIPIVPTVSSKGKGIKELFDKIIEVYENIDTVSSHIHLNYGKDVEKSIKRIQDAIWINKSFTDLVSSRFLSVKLIEKDQEVDGCLNKCENFSDIKQIAQKEILQLENAYKEDSETIIADARYGFISGALKETFHQKSDRKKRRTFSDRVDNYLTHKYLGFPIFIAFLWLMFQATFKLGNYPMDWIDMSMGWISDSISAILPDGFIKNLLVDGIISGVGGVIIFLPNILILFFFISLLEDTGYMARVAFIMDKLMHLIGLHGRSFIPLIMGFGCNVPAIMATRTLRNKNDRILTMLIIPFMSCSARLPIYVLIAGAIFPGNPGNVIFSLYIIGILLSVLVALTMKRLVFKKTEVPFVMELPPYRIPTFKSIVRHMWSKAVEYLKKMGGIILIASVIIWALGYFPRDIEYSKNYAELIENTTNEQEITALTIQKKQEKQAKSYIGQLGHFIEPVIMPLGFDWKMGVSLITGAAAKEVVVSTMGILYQSEDESTSLSEKIKIQTYDNGKNKGKTVFTSLTAFTFLLFVLIYMPCIAVVAAIKKETARWKWAIFSIIYTTSLAWIISFLVYQTGSLFL